MRISNVLHSLAFASLALGATALLGCASQEQDDADDVEGVAEPLPANLAPGKEDGIGRRGLAVDGDYADTEAKSKKSMGRSHHSRSQKSWHGVAGELGPIVG